LATLATFWKFPVRYEIILKVRSLCSLQAGRFVKWFTRESCHAQVNARRTFSLPTIFPEALSLSRQGLFLSFGHGFLVKVYYLHPPASHRCLTMTIVVTPQAYPNIGNLLCELETFRKQFLLMSMRIVWACVFRPGKLHSSCSLASSASGFRFGSGAPTFEHVTSGGHKRRGKVPVAADTRPIKEDDSLL
jgi:hypothetical protein